MREIRRTHSFEQSLNRLTRKHRDLADTVNGALERYADENVEPPTTTRQTGIGGLPVFKERLRLRGGGKRTGARLIFYCDADVVIALFIYTKSNAGLIAVNEIRDALAGSSLDL